MFFPLLLRCAAEILCHCGVESFWFLSRPPAIHQPQFKRNSVAIQMWSDYQLSVINRSAICALPSCANFLFFWQVERWVFPCSPAYALSGGSHESFLYSPACSTPSCSLGPLSNSSVCPLFFGFYNLPWTSHTFGHSPRHLNNFLFQVSQDSELFSILVGAQHILIT